MPAKKSRMALKAALLAPAGSILAWGVQQAIAGDAVAGVAAVLIGTAFVAGFVVLQEHDIPYEEEIVALIAQNKDQFSEETVQDISKEVSDAAEERDIDLDGSDENDGA